MTQKTPRLRLTRAAQMQRPTGQFNDVEAAIRLPRDFAVTQSSTGATTSRRSWLHGRTMLCVGTCPDFLSELGALFDARVLSTRCPDTDDIGEFSTLLPGADCVLCPANSMDGATLENLQQCCKLQRKPFVPLRNASRTCYRHAFMKIADQLLHRGASDVERR